MTNYAIYSYKNIKKHLISLSEAAVASGPAQSMQNVKTRSIKKTHKVYIDLEETWLAQEFNLVYTSCFVGVFQYHLKPTKYVLLLRNY